MNADWPAGRQLTPPQNLLAPSRSSCPPSAIVPGCALRRRRLSPFPSHYTSIAATITLTSSSSPS